MSIEQAHKKASKGFLQLAVIFFVVSLMMIGIVTWYFIKVIEPLTDPLVKGKDALERVFKTEVKTDGYSLKLKTDSIKELATVERDVESVVKYEATFLGQKKLLILKGKFKAKAGFDLAEAGDLLIENGEITGELPKAKILSVEMVNYEVFHSQDRAFNKLTPEDQEAATKSLLSQAKEDAEQSDLKFQAERRLNERLEDLME